MHSFFYFCNGKYGSNRQKSVVCKYYTNRCALFDIYV